MFPLELQHGNQASSRTAGETQGSFLVVPGNLGFLESCHRGLRAALKVQ